MTATAEQIAARADYDTKVRAEADTALADPDQVARLIDILMYQKLGPNVLSYSLRNQALVIQQCEDRGIPLSDVYGLREWRKRGRKVRPGLDRPGPGLNVGIRIVAGRDTEDDDGREQDEATATHRDDKSENHEKRRRFWMISVFDRSMTDPVLDDGDAPPTAVSDAARLLLNNLTNQVTRRGYEIVEDTPHSDTPRPTNIDHDAATIAVAETATARDRILTLALSLAQIHTHTKQTRDTARQQRKSPVASAAR